MLERLKLAWRLLRDPRVPLHVKAIPVLALVYLLSPLDFIPDTLIGLGQLDDISILLGGLRLFEMLSPPHVVDEHRLEAYEHRPKGKVIDASDYTILHPEDDSNQKQGQA